MAQMIPLLVPLAERLGVAPGHQNGVGPCAAGAFTINPFVIVNAFTDS